MAAVVNGHDMDQVMQMYQFAVKYGKKQHGSRYGRLMSLEATRLTLATCAKNSKLPIEIQQDLGSSLSSIVNTASFITCIYMPTVIH